MWFIYKYYPQMEDDYEVLLITMYCWPILIYQTLEQMMIPCAIRLYEKRQYRIPNYKRFCFELRKLQLGVEALSKYDHIEQVRLWLFNYNTYKIKIHIN